MEPRLGRRAVSEADGRKEEGPIRGGAVVRQGWRHRAIWMPRGLPRELATGAAVPVTWSRWSGSTPAKARATGVCARMRSSRSLK